MGVDGYISRKQDGTLGYLFKDAHGDVLAAYSSTTNKLADYSYNAWGEMQTENETSSFTNNPLRYNGQYYDYESGMTYLRARYYSSEYRRFITEDPIRDGSNWYAYAGNNPVNRMDSNGKNWVTIGIDVILKYGVKIASQINNASNRAYNNAMIKASSWGLSNAHNNRADAMRHFQWNAVMSREIGADVAKYVGDQYEINEVKSKNYFTEEVNGVVKMTIGQEELMDLWNNSVGRTLAQDDDLRNMNYDELFYFAEANHLLILDADNAFEFYGISAYVNWESWTVDVKYNRSRETIIVTKEGLSDIELEVGVNSWW